LLRHSDIRSLVEAPTEPEAAPARVWVLDQRWKVSRTALLKGAVGAAVAWSLSLVEMFPLTRVALADGYDVWTSTTSGPCGAGGYAQNHGCSPGCGPSTVCDGTSDGSCCTSGWHRHDGTEYSGYQLRPNECYQSFYDAWQWRCSSTVVYRCHDGWTYSGIQSWKTICRHNV
jgi:hypothetical protein